MGLEYFIDPEIRKAPRKIFIALADAGIIIAQLFLLLVAVSVIDVCVNFTNFTGILTIDILNWLKSVSIFTTGSRICLVFLFKTN